MRIDSAVHAGLALTLSSAALAVTTGCTTTTSGGEAPATAGQEAGAETLIVYYDASNPGAHERVLAYAKQARHSVVYDLATTRAVVVGNVKAPDVQTTIDAYRAIPGVLSAQVSQTEQLTGATPPQR